MVYGYSFFNFLFKFMHVTLNEMKWNIVSETISVQLIPNSNWSKGDSLAIQVTGVARIVSKK